MGAYEYETKTKLDKMKGSERIKFEEILKEVTLNNSIFYREDRTAFTITCMENTYRIDVDSKVNDENLTKQYSKDTKLWKLQVQRNGKGTSDTYANVVYPESDKKDFYKQIVYAIIRSLIVQQGVYVTEGK